MRTALTVLLVAAVVGAGCGRTEEDIVGDDGMPVPTPTPAARLSLEVEVPSPLRSGEPVEWVLVLSNEGTSTASVEMPSGQRGDIVLTRDGDERYRWSEGRAFTMALVSLEVEAGGRERFVLEEESLDVDPGTYELEATSTAEPGPEPVRTTVTVEG